MCLQSRLRSRYGFPVHLLKYYFRDCVDVVIIYNVTNKVQPSNALGGIILQQTNPDIATKEQSNETVLHLVIII